MEIRKCSRSELVGYYSAPGFDGEGIRQVLKETSERTGSKNARTARTITLRLTQTNMPLDLRTTLKDFMTVWDSMGAIRGELLEEFGVEVGSPDISYEAEILDN